MCRLFGLSASPHRVHAKFWLLEAPDSLVTQSHRNPDGTGLGFFDAEGTPVLDKEPLPAFEDPAFVREAKHVESTVFISHIRFATTGIKTVENCHPFAMDGRIFAHNGVVEGLERLEAYLGDDMKLVRGQTDSERYFALITREIRAHDGDVNAGINAAVRWVVDNLAVRSMNFLLATPMELWGFRYPETDRLYILERQPGGHHGDRELHFVSRHLRVHSPHLVRHPSIVVASEPLDDSPRWRELRCGELVHVGANLKVSSHILVDGPPPHPLTTNYRATQEEANREPQRTPSGPREVHPH